MKYVLQKGDEESTWVVSCAWVHSEAAVLQGGDWADKAVLVYPARYDARRDTTEVTGDPVPYKKFTTAARKARRLVQQPVAQSA